MTTNFVRAGYQEVIDLNTETNTVSIVGLHTPTGDVPVKMLKPFWDAYQKVRYKGCKISLIPSARLPADISQVGYEGGTQPIDPRDLLNPILFHGCHGNDMGSILNQFYSCQDPSGGASSLTRNFGSSVEQNIHVSNYGSEQLEALYYKAMVDGTWYKSNPQRGFSKNLRPLVYSLAANLSLNPASANVEEARDRQTPLIHDSTYTVDGEPASGYEGIIGFSNVDSNGDANGNGSVFGHYPQGLVGQYSYPGVGSYSISSDYDNTFMQFMTPRLQRLGWLDTRQIVAESKTTESFTDVDDPQEFLEQVSLANGLFYVNKQSVPTHLPKIFMGMILLPPSYKAKIYMRLVISHYFEFAKYRGMSMQEPNRGMVNKCVAHSMWFTQVGASSKNGTDRESDGNDREIGDTEPSDGGEFKS